MGAVLIVPGNDRNFKAYKYQNLPGDVSSQVVQKNHSLIKQFKDIIQQNEKILYPKFKSVDIFKNGLIKEADWANVLSQFFDNEISAKHLIALKDFLCECESLTKLVNYTTLFNKKSISDPKNQQMLILIKNLFDILDKNRDKQISLSEAKDALSIMNKKIGLTSQAQKQCLQFLKETDRNGDSLIDLEEFQKAFFDDEEKEASQLNYSARSDEESDSGEIPIVRV